MQRPQGPYRFGTEAARRAWVARIIAAGQATQRKAAVRALQVGDVLRAMWGYDQTNIDYYEVTALIGATMVQVRKIAAQRAEDLHMQGDCVPAPGRYTSEPMRRRAQGDRVTIDSVRSAYRITPTVDTAGVRAYAPDHWTAYH